MSESSGLWFSRKGESACVFACVMRHGRHDIGIRDRCGLRSREKHVRKVEVRFPWQDEHFRFDGSHGGGEVAVVGFLLAAVTGLPGVEHGEEVFWLFLGDAKLVILGK